MCFSWFRVFKWIFTTIGHFLEESTIAPLEKIFPTTMGTDRKRKRKNSLFGNWERDENDYCKMQLD